MKIGIYIEADDGKKYSKGVIVDRIPDKDFVGKSTFCKSLYMLLNSMSRTMLIKLNIPFFVDLEHKMDGSILGAKFTINKERHEKIKDKIR